MESQINSLLTSSIFDKNIIDQIESGNFDSKLLKDQKDITELLKHTFENTFASNKKNLKKIIDITHQEAEQNPEFYTKYKKVKKLLIKFRELNQESKHSKTLDKALRDEILFLSYPKYTPYLKINAERSVKDYFELLPKERFFQQFFGLTCASTLKIAEGKALTGSGAPIFSSRYEIMFLKKFLDKELLSRNDYNLVNTYYEDISRSYDLNQILHFLTDREIAASYWSCADLIQKDAMHLEHGESLHLDVNIQDHAFRLQIQRDQAFFHVTLFDTSGQLEFSHNPSLTTTKDLAFARKGATALSFEIPRDIMKKEGKHYLTEIIKLNSKDAAESSKGFIRNHKNFVDTFKSIGKKFALSNVQTTQKAGNCSVQRTRADQKKNLGPALYQKLRKFVIGTIKEEYAQMARQTLNNKEIQDLENLSIKSLTKQELKEARKFFSDLETLPKNYEEWKKVFQVLNHNIARYSRSI